MVIVWAAWIGALIAIIITFAWLWHFAGKIESDEREEQQWREYIQYLWGVDQNQAWQWQQAYEQRFLR
jgi:uncharacterized membrane protein (DUF106 family)